MSGEGTVDRRLAKVVSDVQMPLDNLSYTIEAYLLANGSRLDTETRFLLAGIRDCADRVAGSVRELSCRAPGPSSCKKKAPPIAPENRSGTSA